MQGHPYLDACQAWQLIWRTGALPFCYAIYFGSFFSSIPGNSTKIQAVQVCCKSKNRFLRAKQRCLQRAQFKTSLFTTGLQAIAFGQGARAAFYYQKQNENGSQPRRNAGMRERS
jgi:hypothetical protein